jgi:hypothetical protein
MPPNTSRITRTARQLKLLAGDGAGASKSRRLVFLATIAWFRYQDERKQIGDFGPYHRMYNELWRLINRAS